ncbi:2-dehydro-3-deoxygalactonokinase [uncultured Thioclava sp.]|uniref:2-dehydro-3-deoxygalactonokinase n=1 Tax=uncultured Thioclava sp. TaxID=473858 RepID=UPI0025F86611|nr:2-dehydro-3-deoxygalactonokinase [uncultured Thioclava sp.]
MSAADISATPEWIAADWGTTHLRLWAMRGQNVLSKRSCDQGMGRLSPAQFGPVLEAEIAQWGADWAGIPVVACGMVGSRQGWSEAPYHPTPTDPRAHLIRVPDHAPRPVYIACGIRQDDPPDVMRGEETQIAGLLAQTPEFDGVVCLPGTHTKWVRLRAGRIERFQSCMTGELFELISQQSVLRHTLDLQGSDLSAFDAACAEALGDPARAYGGLFALRAAALLNGLDPISAASRLSGLLIGWELAATRDLWSGQTAALIGTAKLAALYARALGANGVQTQDYPAEPTTLAGLHAAWKTIGACP